MNAILQKDIEQYLDTIVYKSESVNGGDINEAFLLQTKSGTFFLKTNSVSFSDLLFSTEAKGLNILAAADVIRIPKIIAQRSVDDHAYLLLEYISPGVTSKNFWESFGRSLAALHQISNPFFGLDHSNYIGRLPQSNGFHEDWSSFYIYERIKPQVALAEQSRLIGSDSKIKFERFYKKLKEICPPEIPALTHGDLWNGNYLIDVNNNAVLIDPAVSFAHREMDLAMTYLFGGFSKEFYAAYEEVYPLEPGFEDRIEVYQLYYLMVHLNLFGISYLGSIKKILNRFI